MPYSYGSNTCSTHDVAYDPTCKEGDGIPEYCGASWCFVDKALCMYESEEFVQQSVYFPGVDLVSSV